MTCYKPKNRAVCLLTRADASRTVLDHQQPWRAPAHPYAVVPEKVACWIGLADADRFCRIRRPGFRGGKLNLLSQPVARGSVLDFTIAHEMKHAARDCRKEAAPGIAWI